MNKLNVSKPLSLALLTTLLLASSSSFAKRPGNTSLSIKQKGEKAKEKKKQRDEKLARYKETRQVIETPGEELSEYFDGEPKLMALEIGRTKRSFNTFQQDFAYFATHPDDLCLATGLGERASSITFSGKESYRYKKDSKKHKSFFKTLGEDLEAIEHETSFSVSTGVFSSKDYDFVVIPAIKSISCVSKAEEADTLEDLRLEVFFENGYENDETVKIKTFDSKKLDVFEVDNFKIDLSALYKTKAGKKMRRTTSGVIEQKFRDITFSSKENVDDTYRDEEIEAHADEFLDYSDSVRNDLSNIIKAY